MKTNPMQLNGCVFRARNYKAIFFPQDLLGGQRVVWEMRVLIAFSLCADSSFVYRDSHAGLTADLLDCVRSQVDGL